MSEPDDIQDPPVPETIHTTADASPVVDLQEPHAVCAVLVHEELQALKAEMQLLKQQHGSEEARITALAPGGYQVVLITRKPTPGELIAAVGKMLEWLKASGYTTAEIPF